MCILRPTEENRMSKRVADGGCITTQFSVSMLSTFPGGHSHTVANSPWAEWTEVFTLLAFLSIDQDSACKSLNSLPRPGCALG